MRNQHDAPEYRQQVAELKQHLRTLALQYRDAEAVKMLDENRSTGK